MNDLFNRIDKWLVAHEATSNWSTKERILTLCSAIIAMRPDTVVEIGTWTGRSAIPMATTLKYINHGRLICIDPWSVEASTEGMEGDHLEWWKKVDHDAIYRGFVNCCMAEGVMHFMDLQRCRSDQFDLNNVPTIGVLVIDGNHGEKASTFDVTNFCPRVQVGGVVFLDDTGWCSKAASMVQSFGMREICQIDGGKYFQKVKGECPLTTLNGR